MFQLLQLSEMQNTIYWMDILQSGVLVCLTMLVAVDMMLRK